MACTSFMKCKYCDDLFAMEPPATGLRHDQHPHGCVVPLPDTLKQCYSCGSTSLDAFSKAQLDKGAEGRCNDCVQAECTTRYSPAAELVGQKLHAAVGDYDVELVRSLLKDGADPNYARQRVERDQVTQQWVNLWLADGSPEPEVEDNQPTTPLKVVVFRISDCMLDDEDRVSFKTITELLLRAGADPVPAHAYSIQRYSEPNPELGVFYEIVSMIEAAAAAAEKQ